MLIINETPMISLKQLRLEGIFEGWNPLRIKSRGMNIRVELIDHDPDDSRIRITWTDWGKTYQQYIPIIQCETNLSMCYYRWFFTDYNRPLRFMKAYYSGSAFVPRIDLEDAFYSDQIESKNTRVFKWLYCRPLILITNIERILKRPHLKTHYRGKPTTRMHKLKKLTSELRKYDLPI